MLCRSTDGSSGGHHSEDQREMGAELGRRQHGPEGEHERQVQPHRVDIDDSPRTACSASSRQRLRPNFAQEGRRQPTEVDGPAAAASTDTQQTTGPCKGKQQPPQQRKNTLRPGRSLHRRRCCRS